MTIKCLKLNVTQFSQTVTQSCNFCPIVARQIYLYILCFIFVIRSRYALHQNFFKYLSRSTNFHKRFKFVSFIHFRSAFIIANPKTTIGSLLWTSIIPVNDPLEMTQDHSTQCIPPLQGSPSRDCYTSLSHLLIAKDFSMKGEVHTLVSEDNRADRQITNVHWSIMILADYKIITLKTAKRIRLNRPKVFFVTQKTKISMIYMRWGCMTPRYINSREISYSMTALSSQSWIVYCI